MTTDQDNYESMLQAHISVAGRPLRDWPSPVLRAWLTDNPSPFQAELHAELTRRKLLGEES